MGSNPREEMDICKCIVRHGGTLNIGRATSTTSHIVRLVEGGKWWEAYDHTKEVFHIRVVLPQHWSGTEMNSIVTYMVLKAAANDMRKYSPLRR
ncbi:hypothetical protein TNCV_3001891 [Trichonephila clavipes]|nr:hypothetical protein TNCV_3001891 [Trichonephila clavipes]